MCGQLTTKLLNECHAQLVYPESLQSDGTPMPLWRKCLLHKWLQSSEVRPKREKTRGSNQDISSRHPESDNSPTARECFKFEYPQTHSASWRSGPEKEPVHQVPRSQNEAKRKALNCSESVSSSYLCHVRPSVPWQAMERRRKEFVDFLKVGPTAM